MITIVPPELVGIPKARLLGIDTAMQAYVDQGKIAGISTLISYKRKVIHFGCYGSLDSAVGVPVRPDSLFRIYSLTKPVISVAALMLYEEGRLPLDQPVVTWIPEFKEFPVWHAGVLQGEPYHPLESDITVWQLLTHTSGLAYGFGEPTHPVDKLYQATNLMVSPLALQYALPELVRRLPKLPLFAQPGATWHYSLGHDVLGHLIEIVSGQSCAEFLRRRIFEPLGMRDTDFFVPPEKVSRFGPLYSYSETTGPQVVDTVATSPFIQFNVVASGGGGLVSSMEDYYRFMSLLANHGSLDGVRLLNEKTSTMMTTNQLEGPTFPVRFDDLWPGMGYGLGIGVQTQERNQVGWIGISGTTAWWYPRDDLILIALPQMLFNWEASNHFLQMAQELLIA